jgi:hypothetical protein
MLQFSYISSNVPYHFGFGLPEGCPMLSRSYRADRSAYIGASECMKLYGQVVPLFPANEVSKNAVYLIIEFAITMHSRY